MDAQFDGVGRPVGVAGVSVMISESRSPAHDLLFIEGIATGPRELSPAAHLGARADIAGADGLV